MSGFLLDHYPAGSTIKALFHTFSSAGASVTVTGLAAADIEIYKDGGTTQRASDNGYTVDDDFDTITGVHLVSIDLSDNSDAGFYVVGSQYSVVISAITVDSQTVSFVLGTFRIDNVSKATGAIGRGTVTTGGSTTSVPTSAFSPSGSAADQFKGRIITFDHDTTTAGLRGQATDITASTGAAAPTFTVTALTTAPASGDTFSVT